LSPTRLLFVYTCSVPYACDAFLSFLYGIVYFFLGLIQDPRPEYKLFGTIVHSGYSQESGHYYAYIKVLYAYFALLNIK